MRDGNYIFVPESVATMPVSGRCIANHYWLVAPEGLVFYKWGKGELTPQCNVAESIVRLLDEKKIAGGWNVKKIKIVYLSHAYKAMKELEQKKGEKQ